MKELNLEETGKGRSRGGIEEGGDQIQKGREGRGGRS
jgi:hypothetical protein